MNNDVGDPGGLPADEGPRPTPGSSVGGGICVACGSSLGLGAPDGGCLTCLARFALSPEDDGGDNGAAAASSRTFGHFELVPGADGWPVKLGRGAMGVTYRARDTVLRTEVALKVIGINVAGHPAARAAFLREARAAARLRHQNVASVFHYGEQDGECFYAMELVEGETLDARLRREGPLSPALVLEIGRQVACALMEAEALGIVHRDLKPANVMFATRRGDQASDPMHIKVIDFGLAQAVDLTEAEDAGKSLLGGFVGTPAFASPEQFTRDGTRPVDTRSDIYSLGVTLWFLLCGKLPFAGQTLVAIREQQMHTPLPLEQLSTAKTPGPVVALLQTMLKADPGDRPQSARDLLNAVHRCQEPPGGTRAGGWMLALLSTGILCVALLAALAFWKNEASRHVAPVAVVPPDRSLAVLPFENLSSVPAEAFFTTGFQEEITGKLARIESMKVIGADSTRGYPPGARSLARAGRELGVGYFVEGTVQRDGDHVKVSVRLVDLRDPAHLWTQKYERALKDVVALQGEITQTVADQLRVVLSPSEKTAVSKPLTADPAAYDLYLRSQAGSKAYDDPAEVREAYKTKFALLNEAVARDPNFVAAYCAMAILYDDLDSLTMFDANDDRTVDYRSLSETALQKARQLNPDDGMVHRALAYHYQVVLHDNEQASSEADLARRTLPNDPDLEVTAANAAQSLGRWEDAARAYEKAAALQPREPVILDYLIDLYRSTRRYPEAERAMARLIALAPAEDPVEERLRRATITLEERADLTPLRMVLATLKATDHGSAVNLENGQMLLALCAQEPAEVSRVLSATTEAYFFYGGFNYPKAWFEGIAARMRGDTAGAETAFTAARPEIEKAALMQAANAKRLSILAVNDAFLGRKEIALREGRRAREMISAKQTVAAAVSVGCNLAAVYAWTGETDLAFNLLDELVGGVAGNNLLFQPTYGDLTLNPLWDPLRSDPRFAPLLQRLAPRSAP